MTITSPSASTSGGGSMMTTTNKVQSRRNSSQHQTHNHHHPYRLEVHAITSVSISLLWSQRPLPLSAIPYNGLRSGKGTSNGVSKTNLHHMRGSPVQRLQAGERNNNPNLSASTPQAPISSIVASRSPNRRMTKVTVRNISPANRGGKVNSPNLSGIQRRESEDWQSDDAATAVDEDEQYTQDGAITDGEKTPDLESHLHNQDEEAITPSDVSEDLRPPSNILESNVTVSINGVPWSQVVIGDSGAEEAFIVVYGLNPGRDYEMLISVEDKQACISATTEVEDKRGSDVANISSLTATGSPLADRNQGSSQSTGSTTQLPRIKRTHTPPMQDTIETTNSEIHDMSSSTNAPAFPISNNHNSSVNLVNLQSAVRKARKDASRAESALRNEIEAIRRGLERMSDVDHRSKQKVLALQESIRQATTHSKDIDEEATAVESEREIWEERVKEKDVELEKIRSEVEENVRLNQADIRADAEEVGALEKELQQLTKSLEEKRNAKEKLECEKIVELEQELTRIHNEIENTLNNPPLPPSAQFYVMSAQQQQQGQGQQNPQGHALVPPQVGRGRGGRSSRGTTRGGGNAANNGQNTSSRRHQHRHTRHHGQQGAGQSASSGSGTGEQEGMVYGPHQAQFEQHNYSQPTAMGTHTSVLNPNNPEFVPSMNNTNAQGSVSNSPMIGRKSLVPNSSTVDYSPTASSRFPFSSAAYLGNDFDGSRRASASHLDIPNRYSNQTAENSVGNSPNTSAWPPPPQPPQPLIGNSSPWAPASSLAPSPQMANDIWGAPGVSQQGMSASNSPRMTMNASNAAPGGPTSRLHVKTSIPFGLNASLLRGGANPSFSTSRLGDEVLNSSQPIKANSTNLSPLRPGTVFQEQVSNSDDLQASTVRGAFTGQSQYQEGGNSAPVSPLQATSEIPQNTFSSMSTEANKLND